LQKARQGISHQLETKTANAVNRKGKSTESKPTIDTGQTAALRIIEN
jgi:hypothetical protein